MDHRKLLISVFLFSCLSVINASVNGPFITDSEVITYLSDTQAVIDSNQGVSAFYYPGITGVLIDDKPATVIRKGANCIEVLTPRGRQKAAIKEDRNKALVQFSDKPLAGRRYSVKVNSAKELESASRTAGAGDIIAISNGIYHDFKADINCSGTKDQPVMIVPEQLGAVVFRRLTNINIKGGWIVFKGFLFEHCDINALRIDGASHCRITQCRFYHCGSSTSTFPHICSIDMDSHFNRIDHCFFTGSKCMSIGQRNSAKSSRPVGTHNRIDHNIFRDIWRYWINGQENIQLGQGSNSERKLHAVIEYNLFDNAWGDSEIFSNKTSSNTYRYNVAAWCRKSSMTLRGGNNVTAEGNIIIGADTGFRVFGKGHRIINNIVCRSVRAVLLFPHSQGDAPADCLIANNTFYNNSYGINYREMTKDLRNIRIVNNIFSGHKGLFINPGLDECCDIEYNLFNPSDNSDIGYKGRRPVIGDPMFTGAPGNLSLENRSPAINNGSRLDEVVNDIYQTRRPQGSRYDIGAVEYTSNPGKSAPERLMPPVPYERQNTEGFMKGEKLFSLMEPFILDNSSAGQLDTVKLPESFCLYAYYHPHEFSSRISILFSGSSILDGYRIDIGGTKDDKRPKGFLELFKNEQFVARGCDTVLYRRDYLKSNSWPGPDYGLDIEKPNPQLWYHIRLIKYKNSIRLILNKPKLKAAGNPGNTWDVPVMIWRDTGRFAGDICSGQDISIKQEGKGTWKNLLIEELQ